MRTTITSTEAPYPMDDSRHIDVIRELSAIRAAANIVNSEFATKKNVVYDEMFDSQACRMNDIDVVIQCIGNKLKEGGATA